MNMLAKAALVDFCIQWLCWAVAATLKTEKFYDLAGSSTFFLVVVQTLVWGERYFTRQKVQTGLVAIWAVRLGSYLVPRILQDGHDKRFDGVRDNPPKFLIYWTIQGVWVFVTLLPTLLLNLKKNDLSLCARDILGWGLWVVGFLFEAIADYQKSQFRSDPANKGMFIQEGLWSISRHPNYFGEILMWTGLFISASSVLEGVELLSVISPMFVAFLLIKVSGIPLLEKAGLKKWGSNPAYQDYLRDIAVLVPYVW
ncbi:uncharacterized protein LOC106150581 [Lingula anatina]|uniref:Uncharacterized protein LOC106150581 n=1 Tax=Lingula anatina TaxID=7574 RepID=A0A1S3GYT0_LINAN|nr:uncharacterized protein LOC106150581 [Lingula anatina]|eukprot:XP_013378918.1 uncharacterized protein LOC106150581 [Lingula anatina]